MRARLYLCLLAASALAVPAAVRGDDGKKELVAKVLKIQQPGIDGIAQNLVQEPAARLWQQTAMVVQGRVAPAQREALAKAVQADIKKYIDGTLPNVRERATALAPATIGPLLEEKFSEDELKQLVAILESPINRRFQQLAPDMQRRLTEKLVAELQEGVRPKLQALEKTVAAKVNGAIKASAPDKAASGTPGK